MERAAGISAVALLLHQIPRAGQRGGDLVRDITGVMALAKNVRIQNTHETRSIAQSQPQIGVFAVDALSGETADAQQILSAQTNGRSAADRRDAILARGEEIRMEFDLQIPELDGARRYCFVERHRNSRKERRAVFFGNDPVVSVERPRQPLIVAVEERDILTVGVLNTEVAGCARAAIFLTKQTRAEGRSDLRVASVEPSSTTKVSKSRKVCCATIQRLLQQRGAIKVGMITEKKGMTAQ